MLRGSASDRVRGCGQCSELQTQSVSVRHLHRHQIAPDKRRREGRGEGGGEKRGEGGEGVYDKMKGDKGERREVKWKDEQVQATYVNTQNNISYTFWPRVQGQTRPHSPHSR